jgi:hypothetical protein
MVHPGYFNEDDREKNTLRSTFQDRPGCCKDLVRI